MAHRVWIDLGKLIFNPICLFDLLGVEFVGLNEIIVAGIRPFFPNLGN